MKISRAYQQLSPSDASALAPRVDGLEVSVSAEVAARLSDKAEIAAEIASELASKETIANVALKASIAYVDAEIISVASGTPEAFADATAIGVAYPTGDTLVKLNLADGYVWEWDGSAWVQGWVYQATEIGDGAATSVKRTVLGDEAYLYTATPVDIDYIGGKIDIPAGTKFIIWRNKSFTLTTSAISIPKVGTVLAGYLAFNTSTNALSLVVTADMTENHVSLGNLHTTFRVFNFAYTVNGKTPIAKTIDSTQTTALISTGFLVSREMIKIDTVANTFGIRTDSIPTVLFKNQYKVLDLSVYTADVNNYVYVPLIENGYLYVNTLTGVLGSGALTSMTQDHVLLGYIATSRIGTYLFASNFTIDGNANLPTNSVTQDMVNFTLTVTSKWKDKFGVSFGDSITWYDGVAFTSTHVEVGQLAVGYQSYMRTKLECTVDNQGYSGADITQILTTKILPYDFTNTDFVTLTSGANDHRKGKAIGVIGATGGTYDTATFIGAMQTAIEHILATKPTIHIYLITPIKGWFHESGTANVPGPYNMEMMISVDYVNAIKQLGNLYSLPVCDWYHLSGISDATKDSVPLIGDNDAVFTAYDLHPTNQGFGRMENILIPFINNN